MFFCIPENRNQYLRKPLPNEIERDIARKFTTADRLAKVLTNIATGLAVDDDLPPTEMEEWLKETRKSKISMYTQGGIISESFSH